MKLLFVRFTVETKNPEKTLSSLLNTSIRFSKPRREENGFSFSTRLSVKKDVMAWAKSRNYPISYEYEGICSGIFALKQRPGLIIGIFLSLFLIYVSTFYVWSVRIEGNSSISDKEILQLLRECGFGEGTRKSSVDVDVIQNMAINRHDNITFLSINVHGTVADVVVHERGYIPMSDNKYAPYNLVADTDGIIVSSLILEGQRLFENGDTVHRGQLLVSGLIDSTSGTALLRHATGKVFARTNKEMTFEVPFEVVEKKYTGQETVKGIRVLGKSFHSDVGDSTGNFDVAVDEEEIKVFGLRTPFTRELWNIKYYKEETVCITAEEAECRAYEEYRRCISTELDSAEIIEELFEVTETDSSVILKASITAIENIAAEEKIEATE